MANLTWIKGMESPNMAGRKKGSKRNPLTSLHRWWARNGTLSELDRIYHGLETYNEKQKMIQWVANIIIPRPQADSISHEEAEQLYEQRVKLEQANKQMQGEIKRLNNVILEQKAS